ncbi:hypothetical protein [Mycolicibacterium thermoresistibile]
MKISLKTNLVVAFILFLGCGLCLLVWAAILFGRNDYLTGVIALGAALLGLQFAFQMAYLVSSAPRPRTGFGADGTVLRPKKIVDWVFAIGFIAGILASALYLAFSPFGMIDFTPNGVLRVGVPAFCAFLLIFGLPALYRFVKYQGESLLRLRPDGFETWSGHWGASGRATWDEVVNISDQPPRGRKIRRELVVFGLSDGRSRMFVADAVTKDVPALREWVRFYWQHPEHREELTDQRALQRLDEKRFAVE